MTHDPVASFAGPSTLEPESQTTRLGDPGSQVVCQFCLMATTLVHAPRAANTPRASAGEHSADPSAVVESLAAHVELVADLLAALDGNDPLRSRSNRAARPDAAPVPGSISRAAPSATLLETLRSGNGRLDDLVRVLASQLAGPRLERRPDRS
jgi:hypothetical protein